jgi:hypothetical protein
VAAFADAPSVSLGRRYVVALFTSLLLAIGYLGYTQVHAFVESHNARLDAQALAEDAAYEKAFQAQATRMLVRIKPPSGFSIGPPRGERCEFIYPTACFSAAAPPRAGLESMLRVLRPLGLVVDTQKCEDPSELPARVRQAVGHTWLACTAYGKLAGFDVSVVSSPHLDSARSRPGHMAFDRTTVAVALSHPIDKGSR